MRKEINPIIPEWRQWWENLRSQRAVVTTGSGETIELDPTKHYRHFRFLSNDCPQCPLFVEPKQGESYRKMLRKFGTKVHEDYFGFCCYSKPRSDEMVVRTQALFYDRSRARKECITGEKRIKRRAGERREQGVLYKRE